MSETLVLTQKLKGFGKRKAALANAILATGTGRLDINKKSYEHFFKSLGQEKDVLKKPLICLKLQDSLDVLVIVKGGGASAQLQAAQLAISKALSKIDTNARYMLKKHGFLNVDTRIKERRKYGLRKARKAPQYSKR